MKKKLLVLLLVFVLVLGVTMITSTAEESTISGHSHCVCGGHHQDVGDHTSCTDLQWQPLTADAFEVTTIGTKNYLSLKSGNYYLADGYTKANEFDVVADAFNQVAAKASPAPAKSIYILSGAEVTICANGKTLKNSTANRSFVVEGTLNLTDCTANKGSFCGTGSNSGVWLAYAGSEVNVYGGNIRNSWAYNKANGDPNCTTYGSVATHTTTKGPSGKSGASTLKIYGGLFKCSNSGNRIVSTDSSGNYGSGGAFYLNGANFYLYGGEIRGATVEVMGGAIFSKSNSKLYLLGGKVVSGTAEVGGPGVAAQNSTVVLGGNAQIGDLYLDGTSTFTTNALTGSVGLSASSGAASVLGTITPGEEGCFTSNMPSNLALDFADGAVSFVAAHGNHCVCGDNLSTVAEAYHICSGTGFTWTKLTQDNIASFLTASNTDEDGKGSESNFRFADDYDEGYFYLGEDIELPGRLEIHTADNVSLCLNGFQLTYTPSSNTGSMLNVWGGLNICDCVGTGQIVSGSKLTGAAPVLYLKATQGVADSAKVCLYGGTLRATDSGYTAAGGVVRLHDGSQGTDAYIATMYMYGGKICDGTASQGGCVHLAAPQTAEGSHSDSARFYMYGGEISGGKVRTYSGSTTNRGGNVYIARGIMRMYGGSVIGGSTNDTYAYNETINPGYGADIHLAATRANPLELHGKVNIGQIGVYGTSSNYYVIRLGDTFEAVSPIAINATKKVTNKEMSLFAITNNMDHLQYFVAADSESWKAEVVREYDNLHSSYNYTLGLVFNSPAPYLAYTAAGDTIGGYDTLNEAAAAQGCAYVGLSKDHDAQGEIFSGTVCLDLNGCNLTGLTVNGTIYGVDSKTADYTSTAYGTLNVTMDAEGKIAPSYTLGQELYLTLQDGDAYTFHRVGVEITHLSLDTTTAGFGYKAKLQITEKGAQLLAQQGRIESFGFYMGVSADDLRCFEKSGNKLEFSLRLNHILTEGGQKNAEYALMDIIATPFVKLSVGEQALVLAGSTVTENLKGCMKAAELAVENDPQLLTDNQIQAIEAFCEKFADAQIQWSVNPMLPKDKTYNILFIGNSYTFFNDMPTAYFEKMAKTAGYQVNVTAITKGAWTLEKFADPTDTYGKQVAAALTGQTKYDFVILQEQSVRPAVAPASFYSAVRNLVERIRQTGAQPILYATWGRKDGSDTLTTYSMTSEEMTWKLAAAYASIGQELDIPVVHVGIAFRKLYTGSTMEMYSSDKSHPSAIGSYVAALGLYCSIFDADPDGVTFTGPVPADQLAQVREAVRHITEQTPQIPEEYQ